MEIRNYIFNDPKLKEKQAKWNREKNVYILNSKPVRLEVIGGLELQLHVDVGLLENELKHRMDEGYADCFDILCIDSDDKSKELGYNLIQFYKIIKSD